MSISASIVHTRPSPGRPDIFTIDEPIEVVVVADPIPEGPIEIILWEFDAPSPGAPPTTPMSTDEVVRVPGKLTAGSRFEPDASFKWPVSEPGKPTLRLRFRGASAEFSVPIRPDQTDNHQDNGVVFKLMVRIEQNRRLLFEGRSWTLVRNFRNFLGDGRPVVTFIMNNSSDPYFRFAEAFWKQHADVIVVGDLSLERVMRFLRGEEKYGDTKIQRGWQFGPWGQVNIVAHGFFAAWNVRLWTKPSDVAEIRGITIPPDTWILAEDLASARDEHGKPGGRLAPPAPSLKLLDKKTSIVVRGCLVGNEPGMVDEIFKFFGRRATVYVNKKLTVYEQTGASVVEKARQAFYFFHDRDTSTNPWRDKKATAELFADKYGGDLSSWLAWLNPKVSRVDSIADHAWRAVVVRVDYRRDHPSAFQEVARLRRPGVMSPVPARDQLFYDDFFHDRLGPNQKSFGTFDGEVTSGRSVALKGAKRDWFDGNASEQGNETGQVRFLAVGLMFLILPPYPNAVNLEDPEQFAKKVPP